MNRPTPTSFFREIGLGLLLSIIAAAAASLAVTFFPGAIVLRVVIAALAFVYLGICLRRAQDKTGRIVVFALWLCIAAAAWLSGIGLAAYVAIHIVALWLTRTLYGYTTLIESALDLALSIVAIGFAIWSAARTDSLLLASWSFFLVQALHVYIPGIAVRLRETRALSMPANDTNQRFTDASRVADEALKRIAAR